MKQAIRENRQGKVRVAEHLMLEGYPDVALLSSRMEVCEVIHDDHTPTVWLIGYPPEFEPLVVGQRPPEYQAIFTRHLVAGPPTLTFRPAGYARQLQEFKEASDEWLRRIVGYALSEQG